MAERPAFHVEVAWNYSQSGKILRYAGPDFGGKRVIGRYDCFPAWDGGAAVEPQVELPVPLARELLEAFIGGAVRNEAVRALALAIEKAA